jgi:hypothetical protein
MNISRRATTLGGLSLLAGTSVTTVSRAELGSFLVIGKVLKTSGSSRGPMGQIIKLREYPNASFRDVTAPNADTLDTSAVLAQDLESAQTLVMREARTQKDAFFISTSRSAYYTTVLPYCIRRQLALYLMLALRSSAQFSLLLIVIFYVLDWPVLAVVQREKPALRAGGGVIIFCRFGFVQIRRVEITHFSLSDEDMQAFTSYIRSHGTSIATRRRYC